MQYKPPQTSHHSKQLGNTSMTITLSTAVAAEYKAVMQGFNQELFEALTPPGVRVTLLRFDGSITGDEVHILLRFPLIKPQLWASKIVAHGLTADEAFFIDEGIQLPFFLRYWRHEHRVLRAQTGSIIVDNIRFSTPWWLPAWLLYPILWAQFAYRKPIYRRVFQTV